MTSKRIEKAIVVINYAIKENLPLNKACELCGYSYTYVKNVKANLIIQSELNEVSKEDFDAFFNAYQNYVDTGCQYNRKSTSDADKLLVFDNDIGKVVPKSVKGDKSSFKSIDENTAEASWEYSGYPKGHIKTLDDLLNKMAVDLDLWKVKDYIVNKWDVTSWKSGEPQTWENFQVKARLEKIQEEWEARQVEEVITELIEEFRKEGSGNVWSVPSYGHNKNIEENNLLELALYDLHIGKLAWAGETGENFDVKIAKARFINILNKLLARADGFTYNKIVFPVGNDFFNADNLNNTTTAGTPQDEDLRWQKTFKVGYQLIVEGINLLKATGVPVDVMIIPGNHDWERSYYLGTVLEAWFKNDEQVNVDNGASPRKYYEFGDVLLGFSHGKYEKENSLPMLMATEQKEAWGRTSFHEWHLGHFHKKRNINFAIFDKAQVLDENLGVIVRYLSSLTGTEQWHHKRAFVGSHKAGEAFIWNDKNGMIGHLNANFIDFDREH